MQPNKKYPNSKVFIAVLSNGHCYAYVFVDEQNVMLLSNHDEEKFSKLQDYFCDYLQEKVIIVKTLSVKQIQDDLISLKTKYGEWYKKDDLDADYIDTLDDGTILAQRHSFAELDWGKDVPADVIRNNYKHLSFDKNISEAQAGKFTACLNDSEIYYRNKPQEQEEGAFVA